MVLYIQNMDDLIHQIEMIAVEEGCEKVDHVCVRFGAFPFISPDRFIETFQEKATGSIAEGAHVDMQFSHDIHDPHATEITLLDVEFGD